MSHVPTRSAPQKDSSLRQIWTEWLFPFSPSIKSFEAGDLDVLRTLLGVLFLIVIWMVLAYFVGQNEALGQRLIFLSISIFILGLSTILFSASKLASFFYILVSAPPLLIVYLANYQPKIDNWTVVLAAAILLLYLLRWGAILFKEISEDTILLRVSLVSMSLTILSQVIIFLPEDFRRTIFNLFPYFPPVILLWYSAPLKVIRLLGAATVFLLVLSHSIVFTIRNGPIYSVDYIKFRRISQVNRANFVHLIFDSFLKVMNYVFLPILENIYHILRIVVVYTISISINFFKRLAQIFSNSIQILRRLFRFLLLPLSIAGVVAFLVLQLSQDMLGYIHDEHSWYLALFLVFKYFLVLFLTPYCLLMAWDFQKIFEVSHSFMEVVLLPHALLLLLLPVVSILLIGLGIKPYSFGLMSWGSVVLWILGGLLFVKSQFSNPSE